MKIVTAVAAAGLLAATFELGQASGISRAGTSVIEHDSLVAAPEPGPHKGGGETTAYSFFKKSKGMPMVFRKRALHPGAAIGYHQQKEDEVYYVLSGRGELTLDGVTSMVGPGTAILTRPPSSHGIKTVGKEDLVLIITYPAAGDTTRKP